MVQKQALLQSRLFPAAREAVLQRSVIVISFSHPSPWVLPPPLLLARQVVG